MDWGNFAKGFASSGFFESATSVLKQKAKNKKKTLEELEEAQKKLDEETAKLNEEKLKKQISFHEKAAKKQPNNHPDKFFHEYKAYNFNAELYEDDTLLPLTEEEYKEQFMAASYDPEKFEEWSNLKSQNAEVNEKFGASEEQIDKGKAIQEFTVTAKRQKEGKAGVETLGKTLESDIKPNLVRLEKQKIFAEKYNEYQDMSKEELAKELKVSIATLNTLGTLGVLRQQMGGDIDMVPVWGQEEQSQYNRLIAQFNRSQQLQGTGINYRDTVGRTMAEQFENQGMIKGTDFEIDAKGDVQFIDTDKDTEGLQYTETAGAIQTGIAEAKAGEAKLTKVDELNSKLRTLRKKYPELDFSFDEIEAGLE